MKRRVNGNTYARLMFDERRQLFEVQRRIERDGLVRWVTMASYTREHHERRLSQQQPT